MSEGSNSAGVWSPLEHSVYRALKNLRLQGKKCLLMVSSGADSVALVEIFEKLRSALRIEFEILHCHHGPTDSEQEKYRSRAQRFVETLAFKKSIPFHSVRSQVELRSEDELRRFRKSEADRKLKDGGFDFLVWGHHQNDFLETQVLRLIRGAGPHNALEPMEIQRGQDLRPLLKLTRAEIISYLHNQNIEWLEDPSNQDESYLRNWLRNNWLPQLDQKCPGALKSLSRSLDLIAESLDEAFPEEIWVEKGISRPLFLTLSEVQKRQVLAQYLRSLGQMEFTHNQIKEILKHLDIPQAIHTFKSAHLEWTLTKDLISAKSPFVVNAF
jgi:tRNA(Ile)-lysidine synthase